MVEDVTRWKELTSPAGPALSTADAKKALRVIDSYSVATQANRSHGSGNSQLLVVAKVGGTIGNQYQTVITVSGLNTALSVTFAGTLLTIRPATNGAGAATSTVNDVIAEIYSTPDAAQIFDATSGSGNGTGTIAAAAQASLTGGVDSGDEDAYIAILVSAATEVLETQLGRMFIERDVRVYLDDWPECEEICLPIGPVSSVDAINYYDQRTENLEAFTDFWSDVEDQDVPARILIKSGFIWPLTVLGRPNAVQIDLTVGYGATEAEVPFKVKQCISFLVAHWYANREPVVNGTAVLSNKVPFTFETVRNSLRLRNVF